MSKFVLGTMGIILMVEGNEYINNLVDLGKVIDNGSSRLFLKIIKSRTCGMDL